MKNERMFQKRVTENSRVELHFDDDEVDVVDLEGSHSMKVIEGDAAITIKFDKK